MSVRSLTSRPLDLFYVVFFVVCTWFPLLPTFSYPLATDPHTHFAIEHGTGVVSTTLDTGSNRKAPENGSRNLWRFHCWKCYGLFWIRRTRKVFVALDVHSA